MNPRIGSDARLMSTPEVPRAEVVAEPSAHKPFVAP